MLMIDVISSVNSEMGMGQYLLIPFLVGMNIHKSQLFWGSPGVQGFDTLPKSLMMTSDGQSSDGLELQTYQFHGCPVIIGMSGDHVMTHGWTR